MIGNSPFRPRENGILVEILVQPRASTTSIIGIHDGALRVRVAAPPVYNAANNAVIELLSKRLGVRKRDIEIVSGATGKRKRLFVRGIEVETARAALAEPSQR